MGNSGDFIEIPGWNEKNMEVHKRINVRILFQSEVPVKPRTAGLMAPGNFPTILISWSLRLKHRSPASPKIQTIEGIKGSETVSIDTVRKRSS